MNQKPLLSNEHWPTWPVPVTAVAASSVAEDGQSINLDALFTWPFGGWFHVSLYFPAISTITLPLAIIMKCSAMLLSIVPWKGLSPFYTEDIYIYIYIYIYNAYMMTIVANQIQATKSNIFCSLSEKKEKSLCLSVILVHSTFLEKEPICTYISRRGLMSSFLVYFSP